MLDKERLAREIHVMSDLETMGNGNKAAPVQAGAVAFHLYVPPGFPRGYLQKYGKFDQKVNLGSSVNAGMVMDASTVQWWMCQSKEAQEAVFGKDERVMPGKPLKAVMESYRNWCRNLPHTDGEWGHGSAFDCVILANAAKATDSVPHFGFRDFRDTRTILNLVNQDGIFDDDAADLG